jgi:hypothetical protein
VAEREPLRDRSSRKPAPEKSLIAGAFPQWAILDSNHDPGLF